MRRRSVLERLQERPELLLHPGFRLALKGEAPSEKITAVDPDGAAAELPAIEHDAVLERAGAAGRVARVRSAEIAGGRREEPLVFGEHAAERVVRCVPAAVLRVPLVHREAVDPAEREQLGVSEAETRPELGS